MLAARRAAQLALRQPIRHVVVAAAGGHDEVDDVAVATLVVDGGYARHCERCDEQHFPRTDPVVIMLITRGNDVLLGRSPGWPEGMYSCLAGFIEPGETIEAAVAREVLEGIVSAGTELVTLVVGEDAPDGLAEAVTGWIESRRAGIEVQVVDGGQPHYLLLLGAE